jgi:hypothetical protein
MKQTGNPVSNLDPRNSFADCRDLAGAVGQSDWSSFPILPDLNSALEKVE